MYLVCGPTGGTLIVLFILVVALPLTMVMGLLHTLVKKKTDYKEDFNTPAKKFAYFVLLLVAACFILFLIGCFMNFL